jgi:hypothetical protein
MKYKIGDTVRIKNNFARATPPGTTIQMLRYAGQRTKITNANPNNNAFRLEIDNGTWIWHMDLLEPINENKIFHLGNFININ